MVGRAALGRPWLLGEINRALDARRQGDRLRSPSDAKSRSSIIAACCSLYGVALGLAPCAQAFAGLCGPCASQEARIQACLTLAAALVRSEEPAEVERLLRDIFDLAGASSRRSFAFAVAA